MMKFNTDHPLYQFLCTDSRNASMPMQVHSINKQYNLMELMRPTDKGRSTEKYIVSDAFMKYFALSEDQINGKLPGITLSERTWIRAFAFPDSGIMVVGAITKENWQIFILIVSNDHKPRRDFYIDGFYKVNKRAGEEIEVLGYCQSDVEAFHNGESNTDEETARRIVNFCVFMDVAEIFEEEVKSRERVKVHGQRFVNKTPTDWKILNANYLKTSIRTEGFKVRGHFRWQPFGPGLSQKKLIFIDSFKKNGYTITAKRNLK